jgi:hypothetical protein
MERAIYNLPSDEEAPAPQKTIPLPKPSSKEIFGTAVPIDEAEDNSMDLAMDTHSDDDETAIGSLKNHKLEATSVNSAVLLLFP